jgi:hypothetical protein
MNHTVSPNGDQHVPPPGFAPTNTTDAAALNHSGSGAGIGAAAAAAAATQQPKLVQTAFIHKLYKYDGPRFFPTSIGRYADSRPCSMLEDPSIQHLISWSGSNESFVVSPSNEFSKVLA